jgi:uncharacterized protein with PhoU and TrkA domain
MALRVEDLQEIFKYHASTLEDISAHNQIRNAALEFATVILTNTAPSADQTAAIRKVREAVMTANAAIALKGKF